MSRSGGPGQPRRGWRETVVIPLESGLVLVAGLAFALMANQLSPRGLNLARNYFPGAFRPVPSQTATTNLAGLDSATADVPAVVVARLREKGLQAIGQSEVVRLFRGPQRAQGRILFVDARDDTHYQSGHVPGAFQLDPYHPENYLATVLPACQAAAKIVVYCHGGDCEDSELAAVMLNQAGVPASRLFVYADGFTGWTSNRLPVETGARRSSDARPSNP